MHEGHISYVHFVLVIILKTNKVFSWNWSLYLIRKSMHGSISEIQNGVYMYKY